MEADAVLSLFKVVMVWMWMPNPAAPQSPRLCRFGALTVLGETQLYRKPLGRVRTRPGRAATLHL